MNTGLADGADGEAASEGEINEDKDVASDLAVHERSKFRRVMN